MYTLKIHLSLGQEEHTACWSVSREGSFPGLWTELICGCFPATRIPSWCKLMLHIASAHHVSPPSPQVLLIDSRSPPLHVYQPSSGCFQASSTQHPSLLLVPDGYWSLSVSFVCQSNHLNPCTSSTLWNINTDQHRPVSRIDASRWARCSKLWRGRIWIFGLLQIRVNLC